MANPRRRFVRNRIRRRRRRRKRPKRQARSHWAASRLETSFPHRCRRNTLKGKRMHKQIVGFFAVVALSCATTTLAAAAPARPSAIDEARMLVGSWSCRTTQAGGRILQPEEDRIERIGNGSWLHGTSRPLEGRSEPVYDFYVGYEGSHWVYIQIYPSAIFLFRRH